MKTKINKKIVFVIFVLLSLFINLEFVFAMGVMPSKTKIDSNDLTVYEGKLWVVNNDAQKLNIHIYSGGPLQDYVKIETSEVNMTPRDEKRLIKYSVNLENLPPGTQTAYIIIEQQITSLESTLLPSRVRLKHKLIITGEYPDKFVSTSVRFLEGDDGVSLTAEVINKGKENINSVKTIFYVNDYEQEKIVLETNEDSLELNERKLLRTKLDKSILEKGEFEVKALTLYDDIESELVTQMIIGKPEVDIVYFDKWMSADSINKYNMDLLNKWNKQVDNVYVDVKMKKDGKEIDSFRTKSIQIPGLATEKIQDYLNAEGVSSGTYTFDMIVNFWNSYKMDTKTFTTEFVTSDKLKNIKDNPITETSGRSEYHWLIILGIIIIIAMFITINVWIILKFKNK